ncbi:unnamed protein product [Symbiodinium sp. KB8]|nr:unnamed protein product [Symbiodinium sp. KB8]
MLYAVETNRHLTGKLITFQSSYQYNQYKVVIHDLLEALSSLYLGYRVISNRTEHMCSTESGSSGNSYEPINFCPLPGVYPYNTYA